MEPNNAAPQPGATAEAAAPQTTVTPNGNETQPDSSAKVEAPIDPRASWTDADWYNHRQQKKAAAAAKAAAFDGAAQAPVEGDKQPQFDQAAQERLQHDLSQYQLREMLVSNPTLQEFHVPIAEAIAENRYPGLSVQQVANLIAGEALVARQHQQMKVDANTLAPGQSARNIPAKEPDFSKMSLEELNKYEAGLRGRA